MHKDYKIFVYIAVIAVVTLALVLRFVSLASNNDYKVIGSSGNERGIIYDKNMEPIALNVPAYTIYLDKDVLNNNPNKENVEAELQNIADYIVPLIDITYKEINDKIASEQRTIELKNKISDKKYKEFLDIKRKYNIKSVYGVLDYKRIYPDNDMFSHSLGYLDRTGTSGYSYIEAKYQDILTDYSGGVKDLVLTVDKNIQAIVRNELLKTVADSSVQSATVIVEDIHTGAILANYNYPSFNPNSPFSYNTNERKNGAIMSQTYPGSTMKIFTLMAALEANAVSLDEIFYCDGTYEYSEYTSINCDHSRALTNIRTTDILKYSCNTAIITIAERLENKYFYDYLRKFGFGQKTDIDITDSEWPALYHDVSKWHRFSKGYLSLGYDLNVTPMQLINAYSIVINGGVDKTPYMVEKIISKDGTIIYPHSNITDKHIMEKKYSDVAKYLLAKGVEVGSTGYLANIESVGSIGKTGTASLEILPSSSADDEDDISRYYNHSIFVGAIPANNPSVSILVLLNGPKINARTGGTLAAPLFKTIGMQIIPYLNIIDSNIYDIYESDFASVAPLIENNADGIVI